MGRQKDDVILEAYITETCQLVEQLEGSILDCEDSNGFSEEVINEIFRIMHTIKGSSSMMHFDNIATLAHAWEDLFSFLRDHKFPFSQWSRLSDLMLEGVDFAKVELHKIKNGDSVDGEASVLVQNVKELLSSLEHPLSVPEPRSNFFKAVLFFTMDCGMENVRAFQVIHRLKGLLDHYWHIPEDIDEDIGSVEAIRKQGFQLFMKTEKTYEELHQVLSQTPYLGLLELQAIRDPSDQLEIAPKAEKAAPKDSKNPTNSHQADTISVHVGKLDELMDLVGELVIAEAMVTQNHDLIGLHLEQFQKASRHLQKITKEIQNKVMEIRMVPLTTTFQKMHRVTRDMSKKLGKNVQLRLVGEETEVDKNIIGHMSDPVMHLVRNAIDHGLETSQERIEAGKPEMGTLTLEAQNIAGEVIIMVKDDGRGLNKEKILHKAKERGLLYKAEHEMTDREIYHLIFLPGFSTKENITEFSGRGVGMDVVVQNIAAVGGTVYVDSISGRGTTITIRIPLTLAIIDGMNVRVGEANYILPTTAIRESFKPKVKDLLTDPDGNEMIMVRGNCYPILRLHERLHVHPNTVEIANGILIMVEQDENRICIFADELAGQQQVVVKALPSYIRTLNKVEAVSGCTLLGDGDISLILDVQGLLRMDKP